MEVVCFFETLAFAAVHGFTPEKHNSSMLQWILNRLYVNRTHWDHDKVQ
jgi:hypothetical protein